MSSGGFAYDEPEDMEASPWLSKAGHYHFVVMEQDPSPLNKDKSAHVDGLKIKLGVLAGTDPSQVDKQNEQILFRGKPTDKDGGKFANLKLHRLFVATGLKNGLNPGQKTVIDTSLLVGRQFIAEIEARADSANPSIVRHNFKGDRIFHIDDPEVAAVPKNLEALGMIPQELRRPASSFTPVGNGQAQAQAPAPAAAKKTNPMDLLNAGRQQQQAPVGAPAGAVDPGSI